MPPTEATKNRIDVLMVAATFAATVAMATIGYVMRNFDVRMGVVEQRSLRTELTVVRAVEHTEQHDQNAALHIDNIAANTRRSIDNKHQIGVLLERLSVKQGLRFSPNTAGDARRLEALMEELRQQTN